jgi:hypothetical protein
MPCTLSKIGTIVFGDGSEVVYSGFSTLTDAFSDNTGLATTGVGQALGATVLLISLLRMDY